MIVVGAVQETSEGIAPRMSRVINLMIKAQRDRVYAAQVRPKSH